jgi:hypothetical protein
LECGFLPEPVSGQHEPGLWHLLRLIPNQRAEPEYEIPGSGSIQTGGKLYFSLIIADLLTLDYQKYDNNSS